MSDAKLYVARKLPGVGGELTASLELDGETLRLGENARAMLDDGKQRLAIDVDGTVIVSDAFVGSLDELCRELDRLSIQDAALAGVSRKLVCPKCGGSGTQECDDPQCDDSTWDHACTAGICDACRGSRKLEGA